jgi:hypothetical protein
MDAGAGQLTFVMRFIARDTTIVWGGHSCPPNAERKKVLGVSDPATAENPAICDDDDESEKLVPFLSWRT